MEYHEPRIAVVGSCIYEVVCSVPRLPMPGESLIIPGIRRSLGGKGFNQATALRRLGADVTFIGAVGEDWMGQAFADFASKEGIEFFAERQTTSTGICVPIVTPDSVSSIIVDVGASFEMSPGHVTTILREHRWDAILCHYEIPRSALDVVFEQAKVQQIPIFLNPAPWLPERMTYLQAAQVVVLNEVEARALVAESDIAGDPSTLDPRELLRQCGIVCCAGVVVLTLGAHGSMMLQGNDITEVPSVPVTAIDSTGAGDAYVAAITFGLSAGWPRGRVLALASAAGALACQRYGGAASMPTLPDAERLAHSSVLWQ